MGQGFCPAWHKTAGRRYRIGLVTNPCRAASSVRVEGRLMLLATTHTVGEISPNKTLFTNMAHKKSLTKSCWLIIERMRDKDPSDFRLRASLV